MVSILSELCSNLNRQNELHNELFEVLTQENSLGRSFNSQAIGIFEDLQTRKYTLLKDLKLLEKERQRQVKDYAASTGMSGNPRLNDIAAQFPTKEKNMLLDLRNRLKTVTENISQLSEQTSDKAKSRLQAFKSLHEMLTHTGIKSSNVYVKSGKFKKNPSARIFSQII